LYLKINMLGCSVKTVSINCRSVLKIAQA
jgi:hypothetical protein